MADLWDYKEVVEDAGDWTCEASEEAEPKRKKRRGALGRSHSDPIVLDSESPAESDNDDGIKITYTIKEADTIIEDDDLVAHAQPAKRSVDLEAVLDAETIALLRRDEAAVQRFKRSAEEIEVTEDVLPETDRFARRALFEESAADRHGVYGSDDSKLRHGGTDAAGSSEGFGSHLGEHGVDPLEAETADAANRITLQLQCKHGKARLRVAKTAHLQKVFDKYMQHALKQGWLSDQGAKVTFMFDGDVLRKDQTAADLDLDDDDVIDVQC